MAEFIDFQADVDITDISTDEVNANNRDEVTSLTDDLFEADNYLCSIIDCIM